MFTKLTVMTSGKLVRISADTIKKLGKQREGFETPDECMNRILSNPCLKNEEEQVQTNDDVDEGEAE